MTRAAWLAAMAAAALITTPSAQQPQQPAAPPSSAPPPSAQAPAPQTDRPAQPPVFRGGTNQVRVDVTVLDRKGQPITDLTKDDFELREDGVEQSIDTLKLIEATGAAPDDDTSLPIRSKYHAAAEAARDDIRVFVIFWDEYHIGQMAPAIRARAALSDFVQYAFGPTDLVALMDQLTPADAISFTRDRRALAEQVNRLRGRQGVYLPPRSAVEEAQMYRARDIEMLRSQVTATALESTIAYLGSIKEGRKAILFVSQTIGRVGTAPTDTFSWLDAAIRLANANNTTIYAFDPRGLEMNTRTSDVLHSLAEQTGGKQYSNNSPAAALREVVRNARAFYLLGYASSKNPADGKFHKISVRVRRPGVEVKSRTGYYAPSLNEMDAARKTAAANEPPPEISRELSKLVDVPHMEIAGDLWAGAAPGPEGRPRVTVAWTPRDGAGAGVSIRASAEDGHVYFDGPLRNGRVSFDAAPGSVKIRRTVEEADATTASRYDTVLEVPNFAASALSIGTPMLFRARTPLELRTIQSTPDPAPFAGRQFERTDRIVARFGVFGTGAADATVTVTLLSRRGAKLATMPLKTTTGGYELDLSVGSIARGDYVFEIVASRGADQAKALLPFRVN
ncbi:MAG TPA: VWA domain-containing protein [Vicinamibacterales bacterium]|nr:VWA domain-containing protein [Vicinamibacterales bacterium]